MKKFLAINFGCRVNAAETNQLSQKLINDGYIKSDQNPDIILVNTCAVTKKGEYESIYEIKRLRKLYPMSQIIVTGCANLDKVKDLPNTTIMNNVDKNNLSPIYSHKIEDKFSHTHRYLLKIQSGCTQFCSYCIVPFKRQQLWSLPINQAIKTTKQAISENYKEIIITGVNIDQYQYGLSNLVNKLLTSTNISLISFGSIPLNSIDTDFINLLNKYPNRISKFLHIPIQSGSDKILKLMNRPYNSKTIIKVFYQLKTIPKLSFGTDIIVGFPTETESDFQKTFKLCQSIGFTKIHTFRFSPRLYTTAKQIHHKSPIIPKQILKSRSQQIRQLISRTKLPSHPTIHS